MLTQLGFSLTLAHRVLPGHSKHREPEVLRRFPIASARRALAGGYVVRDAHGDSIDGNWALKWHDPRRPR